MLFKVLATIYWLLSAHGLTNFYSTSLISLHRAIELDGRNAVYYCNRAAAHSKLNQHQNAIDDCKKAINIDPLYSKAYGRMG